MQAVGYKVGQKPQQAGPSCYSRPSSSAFPSAAHMPSLPGLLHSTLVQSQDWTQVSLHTSHFPDIFSILICPQQLKPDPHSFINCLIWSFQYGIQYCTPTEQVNYFWDLGASFSCPHNSASCSAPVFNLVQTCVVWGGLKWAVPKIRSDSGRVLTDQWCERIQHNVVDIIPRLLVLDCVIKQGERGRMWASKPWSSLILTWIFCLIFPQYWPNN